MITAAAPSTAITTKLLKGKASMQSFSSRFQYIHRHLPIFKLHSKLRLDEGSQSQVKSKRNYY